VSRSNQQLLRLIQQLIRGVQSGKIKLRWIVGLVVLVVGYIVAQPVLQRSLGIDLPGLEDLAKQSQSDPANKPTSSSSGNNAPNRTASNGAASNRAASNGAASNRTLSAPVATGEIAEIVNSNSRKVYTSPAGLRYTGGSQQGHRLRHLMAHAKDAPDRPGQHGVFDDIDPAAVVALVDEAYLQAQTGRDTRTQREEERTVYDVNMRRRIGYIGGSSGNRRNRPTAKYLRLVVEADRLITAFPVRP